MAGWWFSPKIKLLPQYTFVPAILLKNGVKHHNHNPILRTITIRTIMNNYLTIFLCFSSFNKQISLNAELGTPYINKIVNQHTYIHVIKQKTRKK